MGHDLDDEELKATKNKFYKLNKDDLNKNFHFIINDEIARLKEKYNKSNRYTLCLTYDDIGLLFKYIEKQHNEIQELKDEINEMWSHIPRLD